MESLGFLAISATTGFITAAVFTVLLETRKNRKINSEILNHLISIQEQQRQKFEDLQDDLEKVLRDSRPSVGGENNWDNIRNAFGTSRGVNERSTTS